MSIGDKQRIAAVRKLEQLGHTFADDDWIHPANDAATKQPTIPDEIQAMLVRRADDLKGRTSGSAERKLSAIERVIGAYAAVRFPPQ